MSKLYLSIASLSGALTVVLGAFGAHGLRGLVHPQLMHAFHTAVKYQMFHTFGLFVVALLILNYAKEQSTKNLLNYSAWSFILGTFLFSGSLYLIATQQIFGTRWAFLGPITPIGGLFLILAWILLFIAVQSAALKK